MYGGAWVVPGEIVINLFHSAADFSLWQTRSLHIFSTALFYLKVILDLCSNGAALSTWPGPCCSAGTPTSFNKNDVVWAYSPDAVPPYEVLQHGLELMVWGGMCSRGVTPLYRITGTLRSNTLTSSMMWHCLRYQPFCLGNTGCSSRTTQRSIRRSIQRSGLLTTLQPTSRKSSCPQIPLTLMLLTTCGLIPKKS